MKKLLLLCIMLVSFLLSGCLNSSVGLEEGYYRNIVMRPNGEFIGVDKVKDSNGSIAFKVTFNKETKKLESIEAVLNDKPVNYKIWTLDTFGFTDWTNPNHNFSKVRITYKDKTKSYAFYNASNEATPGFFGAYTIRYNIDDKDAPTKAFLYDKEGSLGSGLAQMLFKYDEKNSKLLSEVYFYDRNGEKLQSPAISGLKYQYAKDAKENALPTNIQFLNAQGDPKANEHGIAKIDFQYDKKGHVIELKRLSIDGHLQAGKASKYNPSILSRTFTPAGKVTKYSYDENGNLIKKAFYGDDDQPLGLKDLSGVASISFKDERKNNTNTTTVSTYHADGSPAPINMIAYGKNITSLVETWNPNGTLEQKTLYNASNQVACDEQGVAIVKYTYDEKGTTESTSYFGVDGEPVNAFVVKGSHMIYHKVVYGNNPTYYDTDGNRVLGNGDNLIINRIKGLYGKWILVSSTDKDVNRKLESLKNEKFIFDIQPGKLNALVSLNGKTFKENTSTWSVDTISDTENGISVTIANSSEEFTLSNDTLTWTNKSTESMTFKRYQP